MCVYILYMFVSNQRQSINQPDFFFYHIIHWLLYYHSDYVFRGNTHMHTHSDTHTLILAVGVIDFKHITPAGIPP